MTSVAFLASKWKRVHFHAACAQFVRRYSLHQSTSRLNTKTRYVMFLIAATNVIHLAQTFFWPAYIL